MKSLLTIKYLFILILFGFSEIIQAQVLEPEVERTTIEISNLSDNYNNGYGINVVMNNFGFGLGGEYRRVIGPQMEFMTSLRITGLRDASEQTFTDFFFGQQVIPNKYQRALGFPLMLGLRQRIFPNTIQDNYRFFVSASMGPAVSFSYPYFNDPENYGYRFTGNELILLDGQLFRMQSDRVNDVFSGLDQGQWHWGGAGEFKIALDIGSNFSKLGSIEFGYFFYYFPEAIQMMMPNQPVFRKDVPRNDVLLVDDQGEIIFDSFFEPQSFFGTPQITFTFGWLR